MVEDKSSWPVGVNSIIRSIAYLQDERPRVLKGHVRALERLINHAVELGFLSFIISWRGGLDRLEGPKELVRWGRRLSRILGLSSPLILPKIDPLMWKKSKHLFLWSTVPPACEYLSWNADSIYDSLWDAIVDLVLPFAEEEWNKAQNLQWFCSTTQIRMLLDWLTKKSNLLCPSFPMPMNQSIIHRISLARWSYFNILDFKNKTLWLPFLLFSLLLLFQTTSHFSCSLLFLLPLDFLICRHKGQEKRRKRLNWEFSR